MDIFFKLSVSFIFGFILLTSSFPLTSMGKIYVYGSQYYDDYENNDNSLKELDKTMFNKPTPNDPWPEDILGENLKIRDACLDGKEIPKKFLTKFDIEAIEVDIVYNAMGFHDP
ncbi:MAG: hypothetical protein ACPKPY_00025, partial [Nitrososphaeraceae archaeon]